MKKKLFFILLAVSFLCWLLPFIARLYFFNIPVTNYYNVKTPTFNNTNVIDKILQSISINDRRNAFILIFKNNIKGCLLNIIGGFTLGLGTFFNLLINGFYTANIFVFSYNSGINIQTILKATLPHSFELLGFWLSGTIGFSIAWILIQFMKGKKILETLFLKQMGLCIILVFISIFMAAYVEAYVSIT